MHERRTALLSAIVTGIVTIGLSATMAGQEPQSNSQSSEGQTKECHGVNSCKGKGDCGGPGYSCAGNNQCRGKGWVSVQSDAECDVLKSKFNKIQNAKKASKKT